jgi:molybdopterin-biosynthesis enzyme MoeA-like protein
MNFYTVIIGSELLNGRRVDAHFEFVNQELLKRDLIHKASFVIKDDPKFIEETFKFIAQDPDSVMLSFGGIGATPDDYTRECASNAFANGVMETNKEVEKIIIDIFGDDAYPHRIGMAHLPPSVSLLTNVVNRIPGFGLEDRFFFMPGFPSMSQAMVLEVLDKHYPSGKKRYRHTLKAACSENEIIDTMKLIPEHIEVSSLPEIKGETRNVVVSLSADNESEALEYFNYFVKYLEENSIRYKLGEK